VTPRPGSQSDGCERLASEWLRALRGRRSQKAFSRRLGYRSNIAYRWEAGHCWPSAAKTFWIIRRLGGDVTGALRQFYRQPPRWLDDADLCSLSGVARLLGDLRGKASIQSLAAATGLNRFSLSRWLKGRADPPLPALLALVEATSLRLLDFVAAFTDPSELPSVAEDWQRRQEARETAYTHPWSQAVLRGLELSGYRRLARHETGWLAEQVGTSHARAEEALELLERTGQIRWSETHYELASVRALDTRSDPERARGLKAYWNRLALERLESGGEGLFSYNVSAISRADLLKVQELQRAHYREMSRIIAASDPADCVVLYSAQLFALSDVVGRGRGR
jgi:transcriptional regulator with XRE-family HTH domain